MPKWHYNAETEEFHGDALYFIQEGSDGPIKIGRGDARKRLQSLQTGNPRELRILGTVPTSGLLESFWHRAFGESRMKGEWFKPTPHLSRAVACALAGERWADEAPSPVGVCQYHYSELMLDALEIFEDMLWSSEPEAKSAARCMEYVEANLHFLESCPPGGCQDMGEKQAAAFDAYADRLTRAGRFPGMKES